MSTMHYCTLTEAVKVPSPCSKPGRFWKPPVDGSACQRPASMIMAAVALEPCAQFHRQSHAPKRSPFSLRMSHSTALNRYVLYSSVADIPCCLLMRWGKCWCLFALLCHISVSFVLFPLIILDAILTANDIELQPFINHSCSVIRFALLYQVNTFFMDQFITKNATQGNSARGTQARHLASQICSFREAYAWDPTKYMYLDFIPVSECLIVYTCNCLSLGWLYCQVFIKYKRTTF